MVSNKYVWFYKNAYHGGVIRYPHKDYVQPDGTIYSAREMAREQGERLKTGGIVVFPNARDADGRYQWEWDPPAIQGNASEIREYPRDLDVEISRGLGIPDSVLTDPSGTGSYAGRRVPERAFYISLEQVLSELINALKTQIIDPLLKLNFEGDHEYEIITKPLVEVMSPEATPPAGYGQGVQGMPGNNSTTIGNVFSSGNDNPDMDMGLSNGTPVSAAAGGVAMSLRSNMAENFIHNRKIPLLGVHLDNNKAIVASHRIRLSNNVEYNAGEYISIKHLEDETKHAGFNNLEDAVSTISKFSNLDVNTADVLFKSTAMSLKHNINALTDKTLAAGYGSVVEAWRDAQKISWLPSGLAYALYNKFGE